MTWEWSHSNEAYENVRANIAAQDFSWLQIVYAEWIALAKDGRLNDKKYDRALKRSRQMDKDALADFIFDKASELRNCTNGGFLAHCCPFECICHMVSFDKENP